jgi:hypothetical protein
MADGEEPGSMRAAMCSVVVAVAPLDLAASALEHELGLVAFGDRAPRGLGSASGVVK